MLIEPGASGNQVLGNQIGVAGPSINGLYFQAGNGSDGVAIESSGTRQRSLEHRLCFEQRDRRRGFGVGQHHFGQSRLRRAHRSASAPPETWSRPTISARHPGGGYLFGNGQPGNGRTAFESTTPPITRSAGRRSTDGNVISSNQGAGVFVTGADAQRQHDREQHHRPDRRRHGRLAAITRPAWPTTRPAR